MSLFGIKPVTESTTTTGAYSYVGEASELNQILFEAAKDIHQIQGGLYVADIMMESQVIFEGASEEVLLEGVVKDYFDKLIEAFRKLLNKIKAWFKKVYQAVESFFLPGAQFVKKYANELHQKDTKGYTYKGYNWKKPAVDALYAMKKAEKLEVPSFTSISAIFNIADVKPNAEGRVTSTEVTQAQKDILRGMDPKAENVSEFKQHILEEVMGGDEKEEIENFSVYSMSEMIAFVKDHSKLVDKLKKAEKINQKSLDNIIKGLETFKKNLSTEEKATHSASINNCASVLRYQLTVTNAMVECAITVAKKQNSEFVGALKGLLRYKPAKEGFGYMDDEKGSSILESAIRFL